MTPDVLTSKLLDEIAKTNTACYLRIEHPAVADHKTLLDYIQQTFKATQGWFAFQSDVLFFTDAQDITYPQGYLLNGECINADGASLNVREDGNGGWKVTEFLEVDGDPDTDAQTHHCMVDESVMLGKCREDAPDNAQPKICYRRYWKHTEDIGYHIFVSRFVGFSQGEYLS